MVCGRRVHRDASIVISPLLMHWLPAHWPQPGEFLPERWLDEAAEKQRHRFAYLPFSGGPRQCIGK